MTESWPTIVDHAPPGVLSSCAHAEIVYEPVVSTTGPSVVNDWFVPFSLIAD